MAKAKMSVSSNIFQLLGSAVYGARPMLPITIRELLQNSVDAGASKIEFIIDYQHRTLIATDNGCGMDETTLLDGFLCLGSSTKQMGVGGFGVAKAAIIGTCAKWEVRTNGILVTSEMVANEDPIISTTYPTGTKIYMDYNFPQDDPLAIKAEECNSWWNNYSPLMDAISYIAYSDVGDVDVSLKVVGLQGEIRIWENLGGAGYSHTDELYSEVMDNGTSYTLSSADDALPPQGMGGWNIRTRMGVYYRLGGLVQFRVYTSSNYVVDIDPGSTVPGDANYPLSLSRESLTDGIRESTMRVVDAHSMNPVSSKTYAARRKDNKTSVEFKGGWVSTAGMTVTQQGSCPSQYMEASSIPTKREYTEVVNGGNADDILELNILLEQVNPQDYYSPTTGTIRTKWVKLMKMWAVAVNEAHIAVGLQENFSVGICEDALAERLVRGGRVYYMLNPKGLDIKMSEHHITTDILMQEAAHEVAHAQYADHDEFFTCHMGEILRKMARNRSRDVVWDAVHNKDYRWRDSIVG